MKDSRIHYCDCSDQPYIHILCRKVFGYAGSGPHYAAGVWFCDVETKADTLYTFDLAKVTCDDCLTQRKVTS